MQLVLRNLAGVLLGLSLSSVVSAAAVSGQGTWEATLLARDLDGDLSTTEAFYDTTLDITWLADAALSKTNSFGVSGISSGYNSGRMNWDVVANWITAMNASNGGAGYLGLNAWRRPTILDDSDTSALLGRNSDTSRSELASLFYDTLGNVDNLDDDGNYLPAGEGGLTNTAGFVNLQAYYYATDTEYAPDTSKAWSFAFHSGDQYNRAKYGDLYSFAVVDGDAGEAISSTVVPVPASLWFISSGLLSLAGFIRKRKQGI